ncbi:hypotheticall protein [Colletotrichum fructicola]|uniref:uncharacterized protein n=1 Tax=Colletotrichum chrysophilum TaxID=1836956 RepID=UPI001EB4550B|nr:uncharacterized protein COL26b_006804 [Colletotrichum chrysophilum]KAF4901523.1 hypotheticall protein [Colletotrichum fructicola]KAF4936506.1 hypotheticall protein [Colletotrichum fructicola]KAF5504820.1 Uncharacterized protein CGCF413_v004543 [Colletotrichum fructicola]KAJ0345655.1 hypothetical protein KNSL1_008198 [Colletotrichum chrysophilum]KAJ0358334.1 hypothetical protein COL154_009242 [Colletotrichum chrysophilum]
MALQYTAEFLVHLRESPLCVKPPNLPPAEDWMGPPPDNTRTQNNNTKTTDNRRSHDNPLLDQTNRRPATDRHAPRNSANPDEIILGPPRTAFASATLRNSGGKPFENDKDLKNADSPGRFNFRNRNGDTPEPERFRDSRNSNFRRRGDNDQDNEGWSTVKPRKSFGHEGAERFHGRMGAGGGDRLPNDRRTRDRDAEGNRERPQRNLDHHEKDKDHDEAEPRPRNGLSRGKSEPWFKNDTPAASEKPPMTARERIDRAKSWRDRDRDSAPPEEKPSGRNYERRWDRGDHRAEREPEWFDEPAGEKAGGHTEEDFKKFMESMKASRKAPAEDKAPALAEAAIKAEQPAVASAPAVEIGPDQFFLKFASTAGLDVAGSPSEPKKEAPAAKPKTGGGKSSRFTSFFNAPQEDPNRKLHTEPPTPMAGLPIGGPSMPGQAHDGEKEAFQALLMKLQRSNIQSTPPAQQPFQEPPSLSREQTHSSAVASPEPFQQYGGERPPNVRPPMPQGSMSMSDILAPRPMMPGQQPAARQDQLLQELVGQRHQASSSGSGRMEPNQGRNLSNTEFLMNLMRAQPEPPRTEQQLLMRMPQPQRAAQIPHAQEREPDFIQGGRGSQRQMRGQAPPGFMDDGFHHPEPEARMQPTQILQRPPPPPGLDQMNPNWMQGGGPGPIPPPQQRSMIPPPGLAGGPGRNHPMGGMFPPNFPPGAFPPDGMGGPPSRNMPPPPGFFGGPPPGFIPPPGMPGFPGPPGPEAHGFPFDGRMPPPGAAQAFRRQ